MATNLLGRPPKTLVEALDYIETGGDTDVAALAKRWKKSPQYARVILYRLTTRGFLTEHVSGKPRKITPAGKSFLRVQQARG